MHNYTLSDLARFVGEREQAVREKFLFRTDPARVIALMAFDDLKNRQAEKIVKVAVISGGYNEPELMFLPPKVEITLLSFEDSSLWYLCEDRSDGRLGKSSGSCDLVLCEQVIEHLIDPAQAFKNLLHLLRPGGIAHVSVPGINGTHGLPHYFYAGFHPAALDAFFGSAGFASWSSSGWGSNKSVMMYATTDWTALFFSAFP
jgi:SAM-dependent methyltransferase